MAAPSRRLLWQGAAASTGHIDDPGLFRRMRQAFQRWLGSLPPEQFAVAEEFFAFSQYLTIPLVAGLCACLIWWCYSVGTKRVRVKFGHNEML